MIGSYRTLTRNETGTPAVWVDDHGGTIRVLTFVNHTDFARFIDNLFVEGWQVVACKDQQQNTVPMNDPSVVEVLFRLKRPSD